MIKLIIFDLDNTLYWMGEFDKPHIDDNDKGYQKFIKNIKLSDENKKILEKLKSVYKLYIINYEPSNWRFNTKRKSFELDKYFDKVWQAQEHLAKFRIIKEVIKEFDPREVLIIGDKKHHEIRVGNILGCYTLQINIGRHASAPPEDEKEIPDFRIDKLSEIFDILDKINLSNN